LVSYETTLPVGTTRHRLAPLLEHHSGLRCGRDLFVCFSPERVSSGTVLADLQRYPKLVGGLDAASAAAGMAFYEAVLEFDERSELPRPNGAWDVGSAEVAELAKLAETTYRDVNIALANEFAVAADEIGIDVCDVIEACNSQPYSHIHKPGIAVGGHCLPVYSHLLMGSTSARRLASVAREVNDEMPLFGIKVLERLIGPVSGATVAVLGAAYRGGVKEVFRSGVWSLVAELEDRGAHVRVHDPLFEDGELRAFGWTPYHLGEPCDAVVVQAEHAEYGRVASADFPGARVLVDGRRVTPTDGWNGMVRVVIGDGTSREA
jgi:nucleotide sugar dehydrogenase